MLRADRRGVMAGLGALALGLPAAARAGREDGDATSLRAIARDAYLYTLPLIETVALRAAIAKLGAPPNTLYRLRQPTTPAMQRITTTNNDTLNARGWIDLAAGPARLTLPPTGERYVSAAMMDMYSNNFAVLGSRTTGPDGGTFTIVGPDDAAPPGAIRSPTRWMWVLVRLLTTGGDDLAAARALQDRVVLDAPAWRGTLPRYATRDAGWPDYFASAAILLAENRPPATDTALLRRIAPLGLDRFDPARFDPKQRAAIEAGVADARRFLLAGGGGGQVIDGWRYPRPTLGAFGQDYDYRAQIALNGLAALPPVEATYLFAMGPDNDARLDSERMWRLRLPADRLPPVDAFWSLTMYRATPDGQYFIFDNPIDRYAIGDRTPGLVRTSDGGVDIVMRRTPPGAGERVNWLPTPAAGPFGLVFRTYRPRPEILDGRWQLPALETLT